MHLHIQAEISRNDVKLFEYRGYQQFLESLVNMKENTAFKYQMGNVLKRYLDLLRILIQLGYDREKILLH